MDILHDLMMRQYSNQRTIGGIWWNLIYFCHRWHSTTSYGTTVTNAGTNSFKLAFINIHTEILIGNRDMLVDSTSNRIYIDKIMRFDVWVWKDVCVCVLHGSYRWFDNNKNTIELSILVWDSPSFYCVSFHSCWDTQVLASCDMS